MQPNRIPAALALVLLIISAATGAATGTALAGTAAHGQTSAGRPHGWATRQSDLRIPALQLRPGAQLSRTTAGTTVQSSNWSGYQLSVLGSGSTPSAPASPYTSVSGEWVIPTAQQETAGQAEDGANWIGIGGGNDNPNQPTGSPTLIQTGIGENVAANGTASYNAWYEIIPEPETAVSMPVAPGDLIQASIVQGSTPGTWTITMNDLTNANSFTENLDYPSTMDTAEWIEEAPTEINGTSSGTATLPNLGTAEFRDSMVNGAPAPLSSAFDLQLNPGSGVVAEPSAPDAAGVDFNVCSYPTGTCPAPGATGAGPVDPACVPLFTAPPGGSSYPPSSGVDWPQLDVVAGNMHNTSSTLTGILTVADMQTGPTAVPPPGTANEYFLLWTFNNQSYYLNAEVWANGDSFSYGTVSTSPTTTFNPVGAATGSIVTGTDGTITMSVPLSAVGSPANGDTLSTPSAEVDVWDTIPSGSNPVVSGVGGGFRASTAGPGYNYTLGEVCAATGQPGSDGAAGVVGGQVPEAPLAALLPVAGLCLAGVAILRRRRRGAAR